MTFLQILIVISVHTDTQAVKNSFSAHRLDHKAPQGCHTTREIKICEGLIYTQLAKPPHINSIIPIKTKLGLADILDSIQIADDAITQIKTVCHRLEAESAVNINIPPAKYFMLKSSEKMKEQGIQEALLNCKHEGGSLPAPKTEEERDILQAFMISENLEIIHLGYEYVQSFQATVWEGTRDAILPNIDRLDETILNGDISRRAATFSSYAQWLFIRADVTTVFNMTRPPGKAEIIGIIAGVNYQNIINNLEAAYKAVGNTMSQEDLKQKMPKQNVIHASTVKTTVLCEQKSKNRYQQDGSPIMPPKLWTNITEKYCAEAKYQVVENHREIEQNLQKVANTYGLYLDATKWEFTNNMTPQGDTHEILTEEEFFDYVDNVREKRSLRKTAKMGYNGIRWASKAKKSTKLLKYAGKAFKIFNKIPSPLSPIFGIASWFFERRERKQIERMIENINQETLHQWKEINSNGIKINHALDHMTDQDIAIRQIAIATNEIKLDNAANSVRIEELENAVETSKKAINTKLNEMFVNIKKNSYTTAALMDIESAKSNAILVASRANIMIKTLRDILEQIQQKESPALLREAMDLVKSKHAHLKLGKLVPYPETPAAFDPNIRPDFSIEIMGFISAQEETHTLYKIQPIALYDEKADTMQKRIIDYEFALVADDTETAIPMTELEAHQCRRRNTDCPYHKPSIRLTEKDCTIAPLLGRESNKNCESRLIVMDSDYQVSPEGTLIISLKTDIEGQLACTTLTDQHDHRQARIQTKSTPVDIPSGINIVEIPPLCKLTLYRPIDMSFEGPTMIARAPVPLIKKTSQPHHPWKLENQSDKLAAKAKVGRIADYATNTRRKLANMRNLIIIITAVIITLLTIYAVCYCNTVRWFHFWKGRKRDQRKSMREQIVKLVQEAKQTLESKTEAVKNDTLQDIGKIQLDVKRMLRYQGQRFQSHLNHNFEAANSKFQRLMPMEINLPDYTYSKTLPSPKQLPYGFSKFRQQYDEKQNQDYDPVQQEPEYEMTDEQNDRKINDKHVNFTPNAPLPRCYPDLP